MASFTISPIWGAGAQLFDNNGNPLSGGKIYTYDAGTTTPTATYTTPIGNIANSNPIIANSAGRLTNEIWLSVSGAFKFVLKDANDVLIATYDNIPTLSQPPIINDASSIAYESGYEVTAGNFTIGATYLITSIGNTDFVAIGAVANLVGLHFTATGIGSGTGIAEYTRTVQSKLRENISVKDFGAVGDGITDDSVAIQAALDSINATGGGVLVFPYARYKINSGIIQNANVTVDLQQSTLDFSSCTDANAWTIVPGNNTRMKCCMQNGTLIGVPSPTFEGPYSTTTNGINFAAPQISIQNVNVQAFLNGFYFDSLAFCVTLYSCLAYFNNVGWNADQVGKSNMGAQLLAVGCGFAHEDYDVVNRLCESTFCGCFFDSVHYSYIKTNITSDGGINNGFLKFQDCRFEAGGNAAYPWFKNDGYLIMRDTKFFEPATYSYLFDNSGYIVLDKGLSRIPGTSRNTGYGKITQLGIKNSDFGGSCFVTTEDESNVYNGNFETGLTTGWTLIAGSPSSMTISTDAHSGTYSIQFITGGVTCTASSPAIAIPVGYKQALTNFYYKNLNSNLIYANLIFYTADDVLIAIDVAALERNKTDWTFARFAGYIPTSAAYAKFLINIEDTNLQPVRIDDIYVNFS